MNCGLWRAHGRIFAHWTCLYFSLCFVDRNFVSGIFKLKPIKAYFFVFKSLGFFRALCDAPFSLVWLRDVVSKNVLGEV